jgi:hypothetical protein
VASIKPVFEKTFSGQANTVTKDDWYDLGSLSLGGGYSPIPTGTQLWLGLMNCFCADKALSYELRSNNAGASAATTAATTLIADVSSDPSAGSVPADLWFQGAIQTLAPAAGLSTGVEKLWLRVQSGSATTAAFEWFIFFTNNN